MYKLTVDPIGSTHGFYITLITSCESSIFKKIDTILKEEVSCSKEQHEIIEMGLNKFLASDKKAYEFVCGTSYKCKLSRY